MSDLPLPATLAHRRLRPTGWLAADARIYGVLILVFVFMAIFAPHFVTLGNQATVLKGMSLAMPAAIGFTIVTICGQLDLSVGTSLTLGATLAVGLEPHLGWVGSVAVALLGGVAVGLANGMLVAWAKVDSFIATLGTMIITQGLIFLYCGGGTLNVPYSLLSRRMETPILPLLTPRVIVTLLLVLAFDLLLKRRQEGRQFFLIGGNAATARNAGVNVERFMIAAFVLSGALACTGGILFGIGMGTATPTLGNTSLMEVVAAVIIGGTAMSGGKGSVFQTLIAAMALAMLYNGLECMGAGAEARKIASGAMLAGVVLLDGDATERLRRIRGRRNALMAEVPGLLAEDNQSADSPGSDGMERRESTLLAYTAMSIVGCVAIVAIFAMYFTSLRHDSAGSLAPANRDGSSVTDRASDLRAEEMRDDQAVAALRSSDGQPLILPAAKKTIPPRPANPGDLPETDAGHWYDMEYSGWGVRKVNLPKSPADGPHGKHVLYLQAVDHPYQTAMIAGMSKVAEVYGIQLSIKVGNSDINTQSEQVDEAINERPDLVICSPVDAQACVPLFRRLNEAGIPVIAVNLLPASEAHHYILAWTGPDDWQQFRLLAREFAARMHNQGSYCIVQHRPGGSPFFSRTYSVVTELAKIAPNMKCLAMQTTDLDSEKSKDVVSGWITRWGADLKGIVSPDDTGSQIGINEAVRDAGREDIVRVAAGNSKVGMDFVQSGELDAITYQSPEADGAIPMKLAADWFYGKQIDPIRYLPIAIITKANVAQYMPAQW